jgi:hypothetical protein
VPQADDQRQEGARQHHWALLELLRLSGWDIAETTSFAGGEGDGPPKALVLAADSLGHDIRVERDTFDEAALVVFKECVRRRRLTEHQLSLFAGLAA